MKPAGWINKAFGEIAQRNPQHTNPIGEAGQSLSSQAENTLGQKKCGRLRLWIMRTIAIA